MSTRAFWERQLERAEEQLALLEEYGEDVYEDGSILTFDYQFQPFGTVYSYAMLRVNGYWYSTGPRAPKMFTWDKMVDWWDQSRCPLNLHYVTELEAV